MNVDALSDQARRSAHQHEQQEETELVALARRGDEPAVRELIRRLNSRLYRITRGIVDSDAVAEEIVQEAYLAAFTRLDSFRGEARFATWITRIAINLARMQRRGQRDAVAYDTVSEAVPSVATVLAFPGHGVERPESGLGRAQSRALLEAAVAELPSDFRLPFLMHEVEGMSVLSIAHALQLNPVTVRTRLFRARGRLRKALEARLRGGFDEIFPFAGPRCAGLADRVIARLRTAGWPG